MKLSQAYIHITKEFHKGQSTPNKTCIVKTWNLAAEVSEELVFYQGHRQWVQVSLLSLIPAAVCHWEALNFRPKIKGDLNEGNPRGTRVTNWDKVIE